MRGRSLPEPGTLAFTPTITFVAVLVERLWLTAAMALYFRDPLWTLLMALGAIGSAAVLAGCAFAIDATSRAFDAGSPVRFAVRVFGGMFVLAAYTIAYVISIVFAFHPATLMVTAPLLALATVVGIVAGVAVGGAVALGDAAFRRERAA
jgi:hypothetical protein